MYKKFPKKKVIEILQNIDTLEMTNSYLILVTRNATIPTIYEYILTIAWFYISESKNYNLHKCFGVTLDGNHLPIIHNSGYKGGYRNFYW
nr:AlwI family type II restriction endonuclease [Mycoplasmopsis bovis]